MITTKLNKSLTLTAAVALLAMGGCSTTTSMADIAKDQAKADQIRQNAEAAQAKKRQAAMSDEINAMPEWVTQVPPTDATGFYAVGQGASDDLRVSMEKARMDGEFGLAEQFKNSLSGQAQHRDKEGANGRQEDYKRMVDNLVAEVPLNGYQVIHQDVKPIQGRFHTYILLRLPFASVNRVVQEQESHTHDAEVKQDFQELSDRIEKLKEDARLKAAAEKQAAVIAAPQPAVTVPQAASAPSAAPVATSTVPSLNDALNTVKSAADALPVSKQ